MASTKVGRWTEDKLKDLDAFLAKHPKTKRIAGLAVAGIFDLHLVEYDIYWQCRLRL